jgi:hypothetical protein
MTNVTIEVPLLPLAERVTVTVPAEREAEVREALATLHERSMRQWEANLRFERAGGVHKRA